MSMICRGGVIASAFVASACSAPNPAFDVEGESATGNETSAPTSAATTNDEETGEDTQGSRTDLPGPGGGGCVPELVPLIEGCLHAAELSKPMDTEFNPMEYWLHPVKTDLLRFCTLTPGSVDAGSWSGDQFLEQLLPAAPGIDPAAAYFEHLCSSDGDFEFCEGDVEQFRTEAMQTCADAFGVEFAVDAFVPGPAIEAQIAEIREAFLNNNCAGACENRFEIYDVPPMVAPTAGGDAVRELTGGYLLGSAPDILRYASDSEVHAPFAIPFGGLRTALGAEQGWVAVSFVANGPSGSCREYQNRALIAVNHEHRILVKLVQSQCTSG